MKSSSFSRGFILFLLSTLMWVDDAQAYIEPGTGSLIIQSLIAGLTGGLFLIKTYWSKIKTIWNKIKKPRKSEEE